MLLGLAEQPVRRSLFPSEGSGRAGQDFILNSLLASLAQSTSGTSLHIKY